MDKYAKAPKSRTSHLAGAPTFETLVHVPLKQVVGGESAPYLGTPTPSTTPPPTSKDLNAMLIFVGVFSFHIHRGCGVDFSGDQAVTSVFIVDVQSEH